MKMRDGVGRSEEGDSMCEDDEFSIQLSLFYKSQSNPRDGVPPMQSYEDYVENDYNPNDSYEIRVGYTDIVQAVVEFVGDGAGPIVDHFTSTMLLHFKEQDVSGLYKFNLFGEYTCEVTALAMVDAARAG